MQTATKAIPLNPNRVYRPAAAWRGRYLVLLGGAGSGKSHFAAQKMISRCLDTPGMRFLIVRKVATTLRGSCFRLIRGILTDMDIRERWTARLTDMTIEFSNGSEIGMAGLDDVEKLKSIAHVDSIWIEEATELLEEDFIQVDLRLRGRTKGYKQIMLSFNPISSLHWLKRYFVDTPLPDSFVLKTTYLDNKFVGEEYRRVLESIQDERLRAVYERGEWGQITKGLIYTDWDTVPSMPDVEWVYGIDFGFNNPSTVVRVGEKEDDLYVEELLYETHLTNQDLITRLGEFVTDKSTPCYCDAAEPQRIEELWRAGYNAQPADKDVNKGIDTVKRHRLHVVAGSINVMNELRTYKWHEDKAGQILDKPVKWADHSLDALRYAAHTRWGRGESWLIN